MQSSIVSHKPVQAIASALLLSLGLAMAGSAEAGVITFTNRTDFQNALASFTVDTLDGSTWPDEIDVGVPAGISNTYVNPDYTLSGANFGGCWPLYLSVLCQEPVSVLGGALETDAYLELYPRFADGGFYEFDFNSPIAGFGFDYESGDDPFTGAFSLTGVDLTEVGINTPISGQRLFFGVIDYSGILGNPVIASTTHTLVLVDNITYGVLPPVGNAPEPATVLLLGASLLGLAGIRRRNAV